MVQPHVFLGVVQILGQTLTGSCPAGVADKEPHDVLSLEPNGFRCTGKQHMRGPHLRIGIAATHGILTEAAYRLSKRRALRRSARHPSKTATCGLLTGHVLREQVPVDCVH